MRYKTTKHGLGNLKMGTVFIKQSEAIASSEQFTTYLDLETANATWIPRRK